MKKIDKIFTVIVLSALSLTSFYSLFLKNQDTISYVENRTFKTNQDLSIRGILSGEFESNLETILSDQFIDRYSFVKNKNLVNYQFVNFIYKLIENPLVLNPVGETYVNQIGSTQVLMSKPILYSEIINQRIVDRAEQINEIASDYPEVEFFVYKPTQIQEKDFFDEANGIESGGNIYEKSLSSTLEVPYSSFKIDSIDDYVKYFYTTDHHWNNQGSYQGYLDIMELMFDGSKIPVVPIDESCKNGLKFFGTYSSQSGFVNEGSPFCVFKFDLVEYTLVSDGVLIEDPNDTNKYFDMTVTSEMDYHYNRAYGLGNGFVQITSNIDNDESILIIGDSYANPILPLLANHFKNIYFVYPINYKGIFKEEFMYDSFIKENGIDKVLFMYTIENYFLSDEWGDRYIDFDVKRN
ncbi:MAG TPA: hypothetical protein DIC19_05645 [Erysipelotrichaceae bacterium]|nr:hypothetical protein [Erysipelotrichaceae bacterium]